MSEKSSDSQAESAVSWRKGLLSATATLQDAIGNLNDSGLQIALVVDRDGGFVGALTDGDIRRALLRGLTLASPIESVVRGEPIVVPPQVTLDTALQLMQANRINALPVVDDKRHVVGLHLLKELLAPVQRPNVVVIMAGGEGRRLRPHTENCPKPLLPVAGKPMLEHIIERASAEGFRTFVIAIHYLGHMIEERFGDGSRLNVSIEYLREESALGTAGAISYLSPRPQAPFLVTNGDVLTDIRYSELLDFHCRQNAVATMAVRLYEWQHPFGVVHTKGVDITGFEEKPIARSHVNAGIYALNPEALDVLPPGEHCNMPALFSRLSELGSRTIVYPMHEPWLDVGRQDDLDTAHSRYVPAASADDDN